MIPSTQYVSEGTEYSSNINSDVTARTSSVPPPLTRRRTLTCSGMQRTTQAFCHEHGVVHRRRIDTQVDEGVVQGILLPPEAVSRPTTTWRRTHQRIEVQQHVALPRRPRLPPRAALHIDRLAEEQQRLVRLALLVLDDRVRPPVGASDVPKPQRGVVEPLSMTISDNSMRPPGMC